MSEQFTSYYEQLKELNERYFNGEFETLEDKVNYLIDKSFLLQHLIMQEDIDRVELGTYFTQRTENAIRSVSEMQDSMYEILKSQEKIEYLLKKY